MIVFYTVSGTTLFFAAILLLYIVSAATTEFVASVLGFLEDYVYVIFSTFAVASIAGGIGLGRKQRIAIPGFAIVIMQFAVGIYMGLYSSVSNNGDSAFLIIFSLVVYVGVMVLDFCLSGYLIVSAMEDKKKVILLYIGAVAGLAFQLTFW